MVRNGVRVSVSGVCETLTCVRAVVRLIALSKRPLPLTGERVTEEDPEIEETALLSSISEKKETKDSPPGPPPGEGVVCSPSPEEQLHPSLGRPSQGLLLFRLPPVLVGAWTGRAAALRLAPQRCL
ncbi:myosin heavy fast skeletal muscle-like protein [Labeo rohita]|uniref:Myosin heavy fast skeletal muscle-like protein n=1 Tax=Labeo rohita TaxID=84645 RepID=A0A498LHG5_LABRO|nr:myosin heavy fast skeletal muscle-like protein [Labeo rohita]